MIWRKLMRSFSNSVAILWSCILVVVFVWDAISPHRLLDALGAVVLTLWLLTIWVIVNLEDWADPANHQVGTVNEGDNQ